MPHPKFHPLLAISALVVVVFLLLNHAPSPDHYLPSGSNKDRQQALRLAGQGQLDQAQLKLERLLALHPGNTSLWQDYFGLLRQAGRGQQLLKHLPAISLDEASPELITLLLAAAEETEPEGYALLRDTALGMLPDSPALTVELYRRWSKRDPELASDMLAEAYVENPDAPTVAVLLAEQMLAKDLPAARALLEDYLALWPKDHAAVRLWGEMLLTEVSALLVDGDPNAALKYLNQRIETSPWPLEKDAAFVASADLLRVQAYEQMGE